MATWIHLHPCSQQFSLNELFRQSSSVTQKETLEDALKLNGHHNALLPSFHFVAISCDFAPTSKLERDKMQGEDNSSPSTVTMMERCGWDGKWFTGYTAEHRSLRADCSTPVPLPNVSCGSQALSSHLISSNSLSS